AGRVPRIGTRHVSRRGGSGKAGELAARRGDCDDRGVSRRTVTGGDTRVPFVALSMRVSAGPIGEFANAFQHADRERFVEATMLRQLVISALLVSDAFAAQGLTQQPLSIPPDAKHWAVEGQVKPTEYLGRKCMSFDRGAAIVNDVEMRDGVIEFDVATTANRGFFGIQFRIANEGATAEFVYFRHHRSGAPDALQYTPVLNTGLNWQIFNGPGFTAAVDIPKATWFHMRLEVAGAQAKLYVKDMEKPVLVMNDLKSGV